MEVFPRTRGVEALQVAMSTLFVAALATCRFPTLESPDEFILPAFRSLS